AAPPHRATRRTGREGRMLQWTHMPGARAHCLLLLCMVPFLCSTKETTSVTKQSEQYLNGKDYVALQDLPTTLANANISVEYLCTGPCSVHLDVVASSEFTTGIVVFKKRWKNEGNLHQLRRRSVKLQFPSSMVYRDDLFIKKSIDIYYAVIRAWVVHNLEVETEVRHNETLLYAVAKTHAVLDVIPPHQRPYKDHHICRPWFYEHWRRWEDKAILVCPLESEAIMILPFPLASNNEHSGLIRILEPFTNRDLEIRRRQLVSHYPILEKDIYFNDTDGYMALGGSKYVVGIDGFFGPVKYYRLKALHMDQISNPLPDDTIYHQIQDYYSRCMHVREIVKLHASILQDQHNLETKCQAQNYYKDLELKYKEKPTTQMDPWTQEEQNKYSNLFLLLRTTDGFSWGKF
ncbi:hypothetical protein GDO81_000236, partial [Engystomops pustulosus]